MNTRPQSTDRFGAGVAVGFGVMFVLAICAGGPLGYVLVKKKQADVRRGWNLVPVVVAAQDIPAGTEITFEMVSQRSIPEQFFTDSVVKPGDASRIVNRMPLVDLKAGDPLRWADFDAAPEVEKCLRESKAAKSPPP